MKNPPNGTAPKSFDTNKKKRLFFSEKKTFGTPLLLTTKGVTSFGAGSPCPKSIDTIHLQSLLDKHPLPTLPL